MDKETNGHSLRSYKSLPSPGNTNIFFTVEDESFIKSDEKIIKNIDKGIIIDQFLGAGQGNILAGEFSMNIDLGYFVENGEIKGRIKDCMVAGNLFELLGNIKAIGDKILYYNGMEIPSVLIESLPIKV
jgi:PmbA protein